MYVLLEGALVNYIVPGSLPPTTHSDDAALMRFRALSVYKREFERLSGVYCFTNTHGMLVVVRQNMCGVPVWTGFRHNTIIDDRGRKTRGELVAVPAETRRGRRTCAKLKDIPAATSLKIAGA